MGILPTSYSLVDRRPQPRAGGAPPASEEADALVAQLAQDMAEAWARGARPMAEEYLARHPELRASREAAIRLIYEEICLRQEAGQPGSSVEVLRRFPDWHDELRALLQAHRFMEMPAAPAFPEPGETLGDFRLVAQLGRGSEGCVFLATQPTLADRPLVLKLTPRSGEEHLSLARLQHTHIVPLYAVHDFPDRNLRALCMPYLGGASLTHLLAVLGRVPLRQRTGQHILHALHEGHTDSTLPLPAGSAARKLLARYSYAQAVCWMGACLADALAYAHERGLVHLDLKPSNVLVAADGLPLLLDFHLAREPVRPGSSLPVWLGGTPGYMSPEQQAALAAVRDDRPVPAAVDGRSDVYALGLLLYEALAGRAPATDAAVRLEQQNPQVSVGLADIIHKCLARAPDDRYADAADLAADLRRHLADLPLRGVANRSLAERWRKWRRRRPAALLLIALVLGVVGMQGGLIAALLKGNNTARAHERERWGEAVAAFNQGQSLMNQRRYADADAAFRRGLDLAEDLRDNEALVNGLNGGLRLAGRAQKAQSLHRLADALRFADALDCYPPRELYVLEAACGKAWAGRARLTDRSGAVLEDRDEQAIREDLVDVALLWSDLRVRLRRGEAANQARQDALGVLTEAEALCGPSAALCRARQAQARQPQTAWEHYTLGRFLLQCGDLGSAARELKRACELQPGGFWPTLSSGICACRQRRYEDAVSALSLCVGQAPWSAECFYCRGLAHAALHHVGPARQDFDRALQFRAALRHGVDPAAVHYRLALVALDQKDPAGARREVALALRDNPQHKDARGLEKQLLGKP